jgi:hypothetical protein
MKMKYVSRQEFYRLFPEVEEKHRADSLRRTGIGIDPNELPKAMKMDHPEAIEYCNRLSLAEGLEPSYQIDGDRVTWNKEAGGYRMPTIAELAWFIGALNEGTPLGNILLPDTGDLFVNEHRGCGNELCWSKIIYAEAPDDPYCRHQVLEIQNEPSVQSGGDPFRDDIGTVYCLSSSGGNKIDAAWNPPDFTPGFLRVCRSVI